MIGSEVQAALFAALTAAGVAGGRVYDRVPENPVFPYVTIGDSQVVDDGGDDTNRRCGGAWESFEDIHVWSRPSTGSKAEVKTMARAAVEAAVAITAIAGRRVLSIRLESSRTLRDPDGITEHTAITIRFLLA